MAEPKDDDRTLSGRLLDCHARIRAMLALGQKLSMEPRAPDNEIAEGADRIQRYFRRALAMHVRDEEDSILPRLQDPAVRDALARMRAEHTDHETKVASLVSACRMLADDPGLWEQLRGELGRSVQEVEKVMLVHLDQEEREIFPAIGAMDEATQALILDEMQARRDADGGGGRGRAGGGGGGGGGGRGGRSG